MNLLLKPFKTIINFIHIAKLPTTCSISTTSHHPAALLLNVYYIYHHSLSHLLFVTQAPRNQYQARGLAAEEIKSGTILLDTTMKQDFKSLRN